MVNDVDHDHHGGFRQLLPVPELRGLSAWNGRLCLERRYRVRFQGRAASPAAGGGVAEAAKHPAAALASTDRAAAHPIRPGDAPPRLVPKLSQDGPVILSKPRTKNRALRGAYDRGATAARDGRAASSCPYRVAPNGCHRRNGGTWGAVFRSYWMDGFRDVKNAAAQTGRLL